MNVHDSNFFDIEPATEGAIKDKIDEHKQYKEMKALSELDSEKFRRASTLIIHKSDLRNMSTSERNKAWNMLLAYLYANKYLLLLKKGEAYKKATIDLRYYDFCGIQKSGKDSNWENKKKMMSLLKSDKVKNATNAKDFMAYITGKPIQKNK